MGLLRKIFVASGFCTGRAIGTFQPLEGAKQQNSDEVSDYFVVRNVLKWLRKGMHTGN